MENLNVPEAGLELHTISDFEPVENAELSKLIDSETDQTLQGQRVARAMAFTFATFAVQEETAKNLDNKAA